MATIVRLLCSIYANPFQVVRNIATHGYLFSSLVFLCAGDRTGDTHVESGAAATVQRRLPLPKQRQSLGHPCCDQRLRLQPPSRTMVFISLKRFHVVYRHHAALKIVFHVGQHTLFGLALWSASQCCWTVRPSCRCAARCSWTLSRTHPSSCRPMCAGHGSSLTLQVLQFIDDRLTRTIDLKVQRGVFVSASKVSNDPSKLVGVHFAGGKRCDLLHAVCIAAENLNTETVSPIA